MLKLALVALWTLIVALTSAASDGFTDPFWQAREGMDVLAGGGWLHPDRWAVGAVSDFVPTSPGWEILLGVSYRGGGVAALYAVSVLVMVACIGVLIWAARRLGAAPVALPVMLVWLAVTPGALTVRPTLAAVSLLVLLWLLVDANVVRGGRKAGAAVVAVGSAGMSTLGIWTHASWAVYGPVAAAGAAALWVRRAQPSGWRRPSGSMLIVAGGTLGVLTGPTGVHVWREAERVAAICRGLISEWMPPWSTGDPVLWTAMWVGVAAVCAVTLVTALRAQSAVTTLEWLLLGLGLVFVLVAASSLRFMPQAVTVLGPVVAAQATRVARYPKVVEWRTRAGERATSRYWSIVGLGVGSALALSLCVTGLAPFPRLSDPALEALPAGCNLFSDAATANLVLLKRPDVSPWIDGRADMWGRARLYAAEEYLYRMSSRGLLPEHINCVLLPRHRFERLASSLASRSNWTEIARSSDFVAWASTASDVA